MVLKETELFRRKQNEMFMNIYESITITLLIENWIIIRAAAIIPKNNALMDFAHDIISYLHLYFYEDYTYSAIAAFLLYTRVKSYA